MNKNKRGLSKASVWIIVILIIVMLIGISFMGIKLFGDVKDIKNLNDATKALAQKSTGDLINNPNVSIFQKAKAIYFAGQDKVLYTLGFKTESEKFSDFLEYFRIGILAGLWIWIINKLIGIFTLNPITTMIDQADSNAEYDKYKGGWLYLVGGQLWKVLIIGMVYGIALLIPIVKIAVQTITFEWLIPDSWFILSFIVAFYIGFLPAVIERLWRYQQRMKHYKDFMNKKYGLRAIRAAGEA